MSPAKLELRLGTRSYDILVGAGLIERAAHYIAPKLASPRAIIVTDETVGTLYGKQLAQALIPQGIRIETVMVPPGEGSKSFSRLEQLLEQLLALVPDRKTTIIALGGGVVGDLAGFAASILLRGVPFIQVPTTLLAQVDSSVGGKTAINAKAGKNLVGSFYQPKLVLADTAILATLSPRDLRCGYAEVVKYGLIMDASFYDWCLGNGAEVVAGNLEALQHAVLESCAMKSKIVGADELESADRALLNFGHTFGHALEAETGYGDTLLHGEAVAVGMVMACRLSARMGLVGPEVEQQLAAHLRAVGLPAAPTDIQPRWHAERITGHFMSDKKAEHGTLTFIVLDGIGRARVARNVDAALAQDVVHSFVK
jgi:3-dehydroquinate synthase